MALNPPTLILAVWDFSSSTFTEKVNQSCVVLSLLYIVPSETEKKLKPIMANQAENYPDVVPRKFLATSLRKKKRKKWKKSPF